MNINHYSSTKITGVAASNAGGDRTMFTITNGPIEIAALIGIVTTEIGAGANDTKFIFTPDSGGGAMDLCLVADIDGSIVGTIVGLQFLNNFAVALGVGDVIFPPHKTFVLHNGTITLNTSAAVAGEFSFFLEWRPLDPVYADTDSELAKKILEADLKIISDSSGWYNVWYEKGTATEIMRKLIKDIDGNAVVASGVVVGQHVHTASP